jgi:hypothetical protein
MNMAIQGARATNTVSNITVFRSWHSRKRPNMSGSASSFVGCKIREILATKKEKKMFLSQII